MKASPPPTEARWHWRSALAGLFVGAIVVSAGLFIARRPAGQPIAIYTPAPTAEPAAAPTAPQSEIVVFVSGAVNAPGTYRLPPGARVVDALEAAGGFSAVAQTDAVNQAAPLHDGDQVHFPTHAEGTPPDAGVRSGGSIGVLTQRGGSDTTVSGLININTASHAELETLPGIGPAKAEAIITNRPYASVDDLLDVPGIGDKTLAELRPHVTVD